MSTIKNIKRNPAVAGLNLSVFFPFVLFAVFSDDVNFDVYSFVLTLCLLIALSIS